MQHLEGSGMPVLYIGSTVRKGQYNFIRRTVYTKCFINLDNLTLTYELNELVLLDCHFIYKTVTSPEDKSSVLLKRCVI